MSEARTGLQRQQRVMERAVPREVNRGLNSVKRIVQEKNIECVSVAAQELVHESALDPQGLHCGSTLCTPSNTSCPLDNVTTQGRVWRADGGVSGRRQADAGGGGDCRSLPVPHRVRQRRDRAAHH